MNSDRNGESLQRAVVIRRRFARDLNFAPNGRFYVALRGTRKSVHVGWFLSADAAARWGRSAGYDVAEHYFDA